MAYCPSCGDKITIDALSCPTCDAVFGVSSAWQPLAEPPPDRDFKRIADFRAIAERRKLAQERVSTTTQKQNGATGTTRKASSSTLEGRHWFTSLLSVLGYWVVIASIVAQLILIAEWIDIQSYPPSESRAWAKMGSLGLIFLSLLVVVPGTLIAIGRAIAALIGQRRFAEVVASLIFHSAAAVLPVVTIAVLGWEKSWPEGSGHALITEPEPGFAMPVGAKIAFSVVVGLLMVVFGLIDPQRANAGPHSWWRGGTHDPFRRLLFHPDGTLRPYMKSGALVFFALSLALVWLVVP